MKEKTYKYRDEKGKSGDMKFVNSKRKEGGLTLKKVKKQKKEKV